MKLEQLVPCHRRPHHARPSGDRQVTRDKRGETRSAFPLQRVVAWGVALGAGSALALCVSPAAAANWPKRPTWKQISELARPGEIASLKKIAECEQPGSGTSPFASRFEPPVRWRTAWGINAGATYIGAYGMYRGTYSVGAAETGYPAPPYATPAQETGVAIVVARRFGYSAWGCW